MEWRIQNSELRTGTGLARPRLLLPCCLVASCLLLHPSRLSLAEKPSAVSDQRSGFNLPLPLGGGGGDDQSPESFTAQLRNLAPLVTAGAPRVWGWGHVAWNPSDPEHLAYAAMAGGVIADARLPETVASAAEVARQTGARLAIRLHPYRSVTKFWREGPGADPTYMGPILDEHLAYLEGLLRTAECKAAPTPVDRVLIDCETWNRSARKAVDRSAWNDGILHKHNLVVQVIKGILGDVRIEWYNYAPPWDHLTLREPTAAASLSLYRPADYPFIYATLEETLTFQLARGLDSTTVYVTLDAGWQDPQGEKTWSWSHGGRLFETYRLGKILRAKTAAHDVVDYSALHVKNEHWRDHCLVFFDGLLGQPFKQRSAVSDQPSASPLTKGGLRGVNQ